MHGSTRIALGCDLGATNLRVAAVDAAGTVLASMRRRLDDRDPKVVAAELVLGVREVLLTLGKSLEQLEGIGIGVAGQIKSHSGLILVGPNLGWRDVPFGKIVEAQLGRHPRVVNDLSAAALGEASVGAAHGSRDVLLVFVGSGVGSGLILGGKLYEGEGGLAGEFGHMKVVPGGRLCGCGEFGCLEAYVGGHNLSLRILELAQEGKAQAIVRAAGGDPERIGGIALEQAAEEGDPEALALRAEVAGFLGLTIANAVTLLNPQRVILGGGVLSGMAGLRASVIEAIRQEGGRQQVAQLSIVGPALGDDAGVIGAALLALAEGATLP